MKSFRLTAPYPTENQLHMSVAKMLTWLLKPPALFTTFPSGWGQLPKAIAGRLHACGLRRGMPDIFVFDVGRTVGIELKTGKNTATADQRTMHDQLRAVGIPVYICRSLEDVMEVLKSERISTRPHWSEGHATQSTSDQVAEKGVTA